MEFWGPFVAVAAILQESLGLFPRNGKLISLVVLPTLVFSSIFFMVFDFSYKSLLRDMLVKESFLPISSPSSAEFSSILAGLRANFPHMLLVDVTFILAYFSISFFSKTATVLVSTMSYNRQTLSYKDLLFLVLRSWKGPFVTGFHTTLLVTGYVFFVLGMAAPLLISSTITHLSVAILMGIAAYIFYLYLCVPWVLAIVISMIEENCFGIEALGKAGKLVQGKRHHGFILNIIFTLLSVILFQGFRTIRGHKWLWLENDKIFGLTLVNLSWLLNMFQFMAYTVFCIQCKKSHSEDIEIQLHEKTEYSSHPLLEISHYEGQ